MASSTRVQLTYEELTDIITCLEKDVSFNKRLFKKLNKAVQGLEPSTSPSNINRYIGLNPNHAEVFTRKPNPLIQRTESTKFSANDSIIELVMNKLATDGVVTDEEREHFHSVAGYYPV